MSERRVIKHTPLDLSAIGRYKEAFSFLHKLDPRTKIVIVICGIVLAVIFTHPLFLGLLLLTLLLIFRFVGKLPLRDILVVFKVLVTFIAVLIVIEGFLLYKSYSLENETVKGTVLFYLIPGWEASSFTLEGALAGLGYGLRTITCGVLVYSLLVLSTPIDVLSRGLTKIGIPFYWAYYFTGVVRLAPYLAERIETIIDSQMSRGMKRTRNWIKLLAPIVIPLCVNTIIKATETSLAVVSRGFDPELGKTMKKRTYILDFKMRHTDYVVSIMSIIVTIIVGYFAHTTGFGYWIRRTF